MLSRLQLTPYALRVVSTYYLTFISLGFVSAFVGPALPFLADMVGVDLAQASTLVTMKSVGFMAGAFIAGRVCDRIRPHGLVQGALVCAALTVMAIPAVPNFWVMLALFCLAGIFVGSIDVGGNILIVWIMGDRVGPFLTGMHFIWSMGALFTPLMVVHFQHLTGSLVVPFLILGMTMLLCTLFYIRLDSPPPIRTGDERHTPLARLPMGIFMAMLFLAGTMEIAIAIWVFSYTLALQLGTEQMAGGLNSSFFAAIAASRLLVAFLLVRVSKQSVLYVALGLVLISCIGVLLAPASLPMLWAGVILTGFGVAALFPLTLSLAPQYLPAEGRVTSWMFGAASVGFLSIPWFIGQLFEPVGPHVIWYTAGLAAVLNVVCLVILHYTPRLNRSPRLAVPEISPDWSSP